MNRFFAAVAEQLRIPAAWHVALGVAVAVLVSGVIGYRLVFAALRRFAGATSTRLDEVLVRRMRAPAQLLVGLLALHACLAMRGEPSTTFRTTVLVVELLLAAYLVIEAAETMVLFYWLGERKKVQVPAVIRHLILVVLYLVAALSILGSVAGVNVLPVLATSTVVTVVLGLALQDTLGNLVSGLALHAERPFLLGDWILVEGIEGEVVYMGWRTTRLRTFSADVVSLPNSVIARARIQNYYAPDKKSARNVELLVAPGAAPEAVERAARKAAGDVQGILADPAPRVWLLGFQPLFHRYVIKVWVEDFRGHDDVESDLMKNVWRECRIEGVELPRVGGALELAQAPAASAGPVLERPAPPT